MIGDVGIGTVLIGTVLIGTVLIGTVLPGTAALRVAGAVDEARADELAQLLEVWCEELDNFLAAIARARRKHVITRALSDALKHPVLENGISEALKALDDEVHFDDLLLVYRHEEDIEGKSLNYRVIKEGKLLHDSLAQTGLLVDDELRGRLLEMLLGEDTTVPQHFGIRGYREEVLINGIREQHVVGRVLVARRSGEFNTFDRDLLERFADYLRQRIVDYNHQWKVLSLTFPRDVVVRLLSEEGYAERYLAPRERDVAILYCDISGFTRLSEQVLGEPALIGELVDTWSARAVDLVWQNGGAFDKMVGDCIIGLWGPPFFEWTPAETCARAARAALAIRDYSRTLSTVLPSLRDVDFPVGVATGLNYCPLFVGRFGPNEDFTGFSSGMNNTARLQGVASRDEILCMDRFVATLNAPERFGPEAQAAVKNVAEPLVYRGLLS